MTEGTGRIGKVYNFSVVDHDTKTSTSSRDEVQPNEVTDAVIGSDVLVPRGEKTKEVVREVRIDTQQGMKAEQDDEKDNEGCNA